MDLNRHIHLLNEDSESTGSFGAGVAVKKRDAGAPRLINLLRKFVFSAFGLYLALTIACILCVAPFIDYACRATSQVNAGIPLTLVSVAFAIVFAILLNFANRSDCAHRHFLAISVCAAIVLLIAQLHCIRAAGFTSGWDVRLITSFDLSEDSQVVYYSQYQNQLLLRGIFKLISYCADIIGVESYKLFVAGGCLCVTLSVFSCSMVCRHLLGEGKALVFQLIATIFLGLNAWILVPYSDTYGMLFTSLVLWFYVIPKSKYIKCFGTFFWGYLGYCIKPTVIFILISIILLDWGPVAIRALREKLNAAFIVLPCLAATCGLVCSLGLVTALRYKDVRIEPDLSFGITHYLAMGMNPDAGGVWSEEDCDYSASFATVGERSRADLNLWVSRLQESGLIGVFKQLFRKNLTNYADGTFAWDCEGSFFVEVYGTSDLIKGWYGVADSEAASSGFLYRMLNQAIWILILGCSVVACLHRRKSCRVECVAEKCGATGVFAVIVLSLLFLSGFLLVFECRARYLLLYAPFYLLLAIDGIGAIGDWTVPLLKETQERRRPGK